MFTVNQKRIPVTHLISYSNNTDDNKSDSSNDERDDDMRLVDSNNSIRNNRHGKNVI